MQDFRRINMQAPALESIKEAIGLLRDRDAEVSYKRDETVPLPHFDRADGEITSPQVEYFGIYALRNAFRGLLLGVNYLAAAERLLPSDLYGPIVSLSYSAAYHALLSLLALHGRVYVDWRYGSLRKVVGGRRTVVAILKKNGSWKFEGRSLSHETRWRELVPLFSPQEYPIPPYFKRLFRYHWAGRYKDQIPLEEWMSRLAAGEEVSRGTPYEIRDVLPEFLSEIARTRHTALYDSFGADPWVTEALGNRDTFSTKGIERQAEHYFVFAAELFEDVSEALWDYISRLRLRKELRDLVFLGVVHPWLDSPRFGDLLLEELGDRLRGLYLWLHYGTVDPD